MMEWATRHRIPNARSPPNVDAARAGAGGLGHDASDQDPTSNQSLCLKAQDRNVHRKGCRAVVSGRSVESASRFYPLDWMCHNCEVHGSDVSRADPPSRRAKAWGTWIGSWIFCTRPPPVLLVSTVIVTCGVEALSAPEDISCSTM